MKIQSLSKHYTVRSLLPQDAETVYDAIKNNAIFYKYHPPAVTIESIIEDMKALPPGKDYADKHYIGFFRDDLLTAVMDLIENYPYTGTALIGFFAMNTRFQGNGAGTAIISECVDCLRQMGFEKIRLGIDKGNPQSKAFWTKNGFEFTGQCSSRYVMMERKL